MVSTDPMERILPSTYITVLYLSQALVSMPTLVLSSFSFSCYQNSMSFETVDDFDGTVCRAPFFVWVRFWSFESLFLSDPAYL